MEGNDDKQRRVKRIVSETVNTLHVTPDDLQTQELRDWWAIEVASTAAKKYTLSLNTDPSYFDLYDAAKKMLHDIYQKKFTIKNKEGYFKIKRKEETVGNQFAKPRQPMSVDKIKNRVNKDRYNVNKFVDNVKDNLLGM